jgi:hypothetical protein
MVRSGQRMFMARSAGAGAPLPVDQEVSTPSWRRMVAKSNHSRSQTSRSSSNSYRQAMRTLARRPVAGIPASRLATPIPDHRFRPLGREVPFLWSLLSAHSLPRARAAWPAGRLARLEASGLLR